MKIGLVCPYNITLGGGVKEVISALQTELIRRGHDVQIITPEPRGGSESHKDGNTIFIGGGADLKSPLSTTAQVSAAYDPEVIQQMLDREQFDILHFHEPWVPVLSRQILSRSKSVNIATFHAKMPENVMSRTLTKVVTPYTKSILKYLHELTAVSDAAAEYVRELTDRSVTIIPNGIDLTHFKELKQPVKPKTKITSKTAAAKVEPKIKAKSSSQTVLYVGRLERRKGVKYLLKAFQVLQQKHEDVSLILAGDGPDREKLEEMVRMLELRNVTFTGYVSEAEKLHMLQTCDLFCAPAIYGESFGIVLLEALASGLVTVAANNPGYASVMQGLGALSLVNPRDTVEFARRMDLLLREESLRNMWQAWAKSYVKQFSYDNVVDQYENLYKQAYAKRSTHRKRRFIRLPTRLGRSPSAKKQISPDLSTL
jgi:phosphatidylinositol alpha-mannosyltransferase